MRNPVLDSLSQDVEEAGGEESAAAEKRPDAETVADAEAPEVAPAAEVPEDEFVDISALSGEEAPSAEVGSEEPSAEIPAEADVSEPEVPEDEFVDISALSGGAEPESEVGSEASSAEINAEAVVPEPEVPEDEFVDIGALKAEEEETAAAGETEEAPLPEPPEPEVLSSAAPTAADGEDEPAEEDQPAAFREQPVSTVVTPEDEIIQTPLVSKSDSPPAEEPAANEAESAEPSVEPALPEQVEEPAALVMKSEEPAEQLKVGEPEEEPEEESPDEGFLEDKTLIAMPVPDLSSLQVSGAAAERSPDKEEESAEEAAPPEEPAPAPAEDTSDAEVEHHLDGEDTLEKEEESAEAAAATDGDGAADSAAAPEFDEERPNTTPNIGKGDTAGSRASKLQPLTEGTVLNGRYEIVRKIGGGGMGAVYLASDKNLGGVLRAVKEMVQSYIEEDQQEKAVSDFKRESMLLTSLEHPSIPTIYDYFFDEGAHRFYLVMKYISGGDLAARLRSAQDGRLEEMEVTEWAMQIADVLDYLHNRQPPIVYRDLKPANIMLDGNSGKVMLIDFGIARWINKEEKGVTAVGTMGYAPPELFSGNVVPSSDIYSLGSTMFHLLTGADPQNNPLLIFDFEKHPRPRQINPRLSDQIESILMRAVEYNAEKRFDTAARFRDALAEHLANLNAGNVTYGVTESPAAVGFSDQAVFCGFCGQKIVATDMFCAFCGAKQPLAQPGVHSQEYIPVKLTAKLLIEGTSQLDYPSFDLAKDENLVGRRDPMSNIFPEVDLSKFDPQTKISRKHARIFREGEHFMLEDLGSSNGTLLIQGSQETVRLTPHQARALEHGDRIKLGDTMLHFVLSA